MRKAKAIRAATPIEEGKFVTPLSVLEELIREGETLSHAVIQARMRPGRVELRASADDVADLYLYDMIGGFLSDVTAARVIEDLRALSPSARLRVHLNSPGGDVFQGLAIYNTLRQRRAPVDVVVEGVAASIASVIAMAGHTLTMAAASMLMIHEPHAVVMGNAHDMRAMAALLDKTTGVFVDVYARRGGDADRVRAWMHKETWFTAREAIEAKLIDAIDDAPLPQDAQTLAASWVPSRFTEPPPIPAPPSPPPPPRARQRAAVLAKSYGFLVGAPRATSHAGGGDR